MSRNIDPRHLMSAQEVVASTLSGTDVSVVFDADTPWADLTNKVIHLRPVPEQLSEEAVEDLRGDCDHELGHIIHTDPHALDGVKRKIVLKIVEAIEDGRIERLVGEEWLGCGENLERSTRRAVARIAESKEDSEVNRRARAVCGLSLISNGWSVNEAAEALGGDIGSYYDDLGDLVAAMFLCKSTKDVVQVAETIAATWAWKPVADTQFKSNRALENAAANELSPYDLSPATTRKRSLKKLSGGESTGSYRSKTDRDKVEAIRKPSFEIGNLYGVFFDGVRRTAPVLRRRLMMQFRSSGHQHRRFQRRGEIDERSLWRHGIGDERLYRQKYPTKTNRSIVTILVDCSASMTRPARDPSYEGEPLVFRTRLFIAAQAAAAVSSTLDALGVQNEVLAFTTTKRMTAPNPIYDRVRPLRHLVIKPYNKPFRSCRANFISLAFFEHCSENIDGEAILWAARRMLSKPNHGDRPVLMVFSDGDPASQPEKKTVLAAHLKTAIERVNESGIALFGIGVGSDAVKGFYENSVVVNDVSSLLSTFYDLLKKVLQERQSIRV